MRISILTFAKGDSYGAVLQSFALAQVLRNWGHKVEFIHLTWYNSWRQRLWSLLTPTSYRFEHFRKMYLRTFSIPCHTIKDLKSAVRGVDLCIVGSDQVWNPDITGKYAFHYFFDFLPKDMPRIAYAASFGNEQWEYKESQQRVESYLKKFTAISVREESGVYICKDTFHIQAAHVLDPTLLIPNYSVYIKGLVQRESQIVSFKFKPSEEYYDLLSHFSKGMNQDVCLMGPIYRKLSSKLFKFHFNPFVSVEKWLENISNASLVVTDSFHCTVFSILYRRKFIVIPSNSKRKGRMYSLLKDLNLLDRYYETIEDVYRTERWNEDIDFDSVYAILAKRREESLQFLSESLLRKNL